MKQWNTCRWFVVLIFCLVTGQVGAATITGTVSDSLTKAGVESVRVTLKGTTNQAYTNALGQFLMSTTIGISTPKSYRTTNAVADWEALAGAPVEVFGTHGVKVKSGQAGVLTALLAGLPDGIYFTEVRKDGSVYTGKIIKTRDQYQTGSFVCASAKSAATVTLVFTHKYYTTKEAATAEGDTNVTMKLTMWFPDDSNTGTQGTLTSSAALKVSTAGAVIQDLDVSGSIGINANNITIRNCRFGSLNIGTTSPYTGTVIENCELGWVGTMNFTLRRCKMQSGSDDLIRISGPGVIIEDCFLYIAGPEVAGTHCDVMQEYPEGTGTNLVVRHNTLWNANTQTSIAIGTTDMLMDKNLIAGAGWSIYTKPGHRIINNHFSTKFYQNCGAWGAMNGNLGTCSGNIWHETGAPFICPAN